MEIFPSTIIKKQGVIPLGWGGGAVNAQNRSTMREHATLRRWLETLPDQLLEAHPSLCVNYAAEQLYRHLLATAQSTSLLFQEMFAYLQNFCEDRRQHPREDLISHLIKVQAEGQTLSNEEIISVVATLLVAGNITTTLLIGKAILCFDEHPEAMVAIHTDPSLLPSAIEEALRYRPPFTGILRVTTTDVTLHGVTIPA